MSPEQSTTHYSPAEAQERLGLDDMQFSRLVATMRAPLWARVGDEVFFQRETVDRMTAERAAAGQVTPSPETRTLSAILEDQGVRAIGEGSPYVRRLQTATEGLLDAFRGVSTAIASETLTELQAQRVAVSIDRCAADLRGQAAGE